MSGKTKLVLSGVTILLLILMFALYKKVSDCCAGSGGGSGGGPGPGPIIVIQPTGSGPNPAASWTLRGTAVSSWGNSAQLLEDAFGNIDQFTANVSAGTPGCASTVCPLQKLELVIDSGTYGVHTIVIERSPSNTFAWSIDTMPLTACDFSAGAPPNCAMTGIPPEFNGTLQSVSATPAYTGGTPPNPVSIIYATMGAKH